MLHHCAEAPYHIAGQPSPLAKYAASIAVLLAPSSSPSKVKATRRLSDILFPKTLSHLVPGVTTPGHTHRRLAKRFKHPTLNRCLEKCIKISSALRAANPNPQTHGGTPPLDSSYTIIQKTKRITSMDGGYATFVRNKKSKIQK